MCQLFQVIDLNPIKIQDSWISPVFVYRAQFIGKVSEVLYLYTKNIKEYNDTNIIVYNYEGNNVYYDLTYYTQKVVDDLQLLLKKKLQEKIKNISIQQESISIQKARVASYNKNTYAQHLLDIFCNNNEHCQKTKDNYTINLSNMVLKKNEYYNNYTYTNYYTNYEKDPKEIEANAIIYIKPHIHTIYFSKNGRVLFLIDNIFDINSFLSPNNQNKNISFKITNHTLKYILIGINKTQKIEISDKILSKPSNPTDKSIARFILNVPLELINTSLQINDSDFINSGIIQNKTILFEMPLLDINQSINNVVKTTKFAYIKNPENKCEIHYKSVELDFRRFKYKIKVKYFDPKIINVESMIVNFSDMSVTTYKDGKTHILYSEWGMAPIQNGGSVPSKHISPLKTKKFATMPNGHVYRLYYFNKKWWVKARVGVPHIKGNARNTRFVHVVKA